MIMILHWQCFHPAWPSGLCLFPKGDRKLLFEQRMQPRQANTFSSNHYWEGQCWELMPFADGERMRKTKAQHLHTHCPGEYCLSTADASEWKTGVRIPQPSAAMSISRREQEVRNHALWSQSTATPPLQKDVPKHAQMGSHGIIES